MLEDLAKDSAEKYETFWTTFGRVLKEGVVEDQGNRERIAKLLRFASTHHGVILAGYSHALHPGPCLVNGRRSKMIEVGMQSAFVETSAQDRPGDEVVLLGRVQARAGDGPAENVATDPATPSRLWLGAGGFRSCRGCSGDYSTRRR